VRGRGHTSAPPGRAASARDGEGVEKPPLWAVALGIAILIALAFVAIDP
jgi:hypothetical protein